MTLPVDVNSNTVELASADWLCRLEGRVWLDLCNGQPDVVEVLEGAQSHERGRHRLVALLDVGLAVHGSVGDHLHPVGFVRLMGCDPHPNLY